MIHEYIFLWLILNIPIKIKIFFEGLLNVAFGAFGFFYWGRSGATSADPEVLD